MSDPTALDDSEPPLPSVTPPRWPLWLFILALLGGAGYLGWSMYRATDPRTVLVAVELDGHWFEGAMPAAELADALNGGLESLGFVPIRPGDPAVIETIDAAGGDLRAAARALGAGFVVGGRINIEVIEHPIGDGYVELRADGRVEVMHVDDEGAPAGGRVRGWSGAPTRERAMQILAEGPIGRLALGEALPRLLAHPVLAELLEGDARTVAALNAASEFVGQRHHALSTAAKAYEGAGRLRQQGEKGPVPVTYHGDTASDDALCGVGAAGVCVKTEAVRPYVSPRTGKLRLLEELETVEWRPLGEGAASVRWQGYNVPGYPRVAADGRSLAFVEDIFGWARAPSLVTEGDALRLFVDAERRFSQAQPAPGAAAVAMLYQRERGGPRGLLVVDAKGEPLLDVPPGGGALAGFVWLDGQSLALLQHPPESPAQPAPDPPAPVEVPPALAPYLAIPRQAVWRVPIDGGPPQALYVVGEGETLSWMARSPSGRRLVFRRRVDGESESETAGPGLAVVDLEADPPALAAIPLPRPVEAPTFSPDGRWLAFEYHPPRSRDEEIAVLDLDAADPPASLRVLTDNRARDRYPVFAPDGRRIFFEQLGDNPNLRRRSVSLIASVPAP